MSPISGSRSRRAAYLSDSAYAARGSCTRPVARSSSARASCPKRRANPSRGRRRHSPTVRTPMVPSVSMLRCGQRVHSSGSGASRAASSSRLRTNTGRDPSRPARANHSDASGVGVMAKRTDAPRAVVSSCSSRVHSWRAPPNSRRLPRTSSSTPSGGSRLTRGVNRTPRCATASSNWRSRRTSRASVCNSGTSASAALTDMPARTPTACTRASQARTTLPLRSRSTMATGGWPGNACTTSRSESSSSDGR